MGWPTARWSTGSGEPEADAAVAAWMEQSLDTYALPHDPAAPVLCMDEQPAQLFTETRTPIPTTADHPKRVDHEYERAGGHHEPLHGRRAVGPLAGDDRASDQYPG